MVASGGLSPQTPCFRDPPLCSDPPSQNPGSAPAEEPQIAKNSVVKYQSVHLVVYLRKILTPLRGVFIQMVV